MNHSTRRALRAGIGVAGLAALGASLTGTAYAATDDHVSAGRSEAADPGSTLSGDRTRSAEPAMHSFELPGSSSGGMPKATSIPVSNDTDSNDDSDSGDSAPDESDAYDEDTNHDGSDVNDRDKSGGEGEGGGYPQCGQHRSADSFGANGNKSDDDSYDSGDYDADCTGFHGENKNNGYNGYTGTDQGRQDSNHYRFAPL